MSEASSTAVQTKPKKKRHLGWLNLLLTLVVFAGGVVLGLKLNTMPEPYEMVGNYFPQLVASPAPAPVQVPELTPAPEPTAEPEPAVAAVPEQQPAAETVAAEPTVEPTPEPEPEPEIAEEPEVSEAETPAVAESVEEPADIPAEPAEPEAKPAATGAEAALEAALTHAKVDRDAAVVYSVYKTKDGDGLKVYQVEFAADGVEYVYSVNASTCEVEGWQTVRTDKDAELRSQAEQRISAEQAMDIACRRVGVKSSEVTDASAELLSKDGRAWYELMFKYGPSSYTYRIDAVNGGVLYYDRTE